MCRLPPSWVSGGLPGAPGGLGKDPGSSVPLGEQGLGRMLAPTVVPRGQCFANLTMRQNRLEGAESTFAGLTLEFLA